MFVIKDYGPYRVIADEFQLDIVWVDVCEKNMTIFSYGIA